MKNNHIPWVEKYRPENLEEIVLEEHNELIFNNILKNDYFPNILLYGPPGTGKTTTIISLINNYLKNKKIKTSKDIIIHLNASDDRGIEVIREKIYNFVRCKSYNIVCNKFIILDEVDYMTITAQLSLKYIIEKCNKNIVFILMCNYISKINYSLQNLFLNIRFNDLPKEKIITLLTNICNKENIQISNNVLIKIQTLYKSDLRSMVNYLQSNSNNLNCNFIHNDIHEIYNKIVLLKDVEKSCTYIDELVFYYNISHRDIVTIITTHFLYKHISKIKNEDFILIKNFFHNDINLKISTKCIINIINNYPKN